MSPHRKGKGKRWHSTAYIATPRYADAASRFWTFVDKTDACWLWTGGTQFGYGQFHNGLSATRAHRFSYELANGSGAARRHFVCHKCDVRNCVRPDHLFLGNHAANMADMVAKGRSAWQRRRASESVVPGHNSSIVTSSSSVTANPGVGDSPAFAREVA